MKNIIIPAGILASALLGTVKDADAQNGFYVSPSYYFKRELQYGHRQHSYYTAVAPVSESRESRPVFELSTITDRREDVEVNAWPYMNFVIKSFPDDLPVWGELESDMGDYMDDAYPQWVVGPYFKYSQVDDKFYWYAGIEGRMFELKGVKAYTTTILERPAGGNYFIDLHPSVGRRLKAVNGKPTLGGIDDITWDLYTNVGFTGKRGGTVAASANFDEGKFRNASVGWGKNGASARAVIHRNGKPGINFNIRTTMPRSGKKSRR